MKKFLTLLTSLVLLFAVGTASALEAKGWRLTVTDSIATSTKIVIGEIEWLYDTGSAYADGSFSDLGEAECGWTRKVPNLTGGTSEISYPCDSVSVNYAPDSSLTIPSGTRRTRLGKLMFDDITTSYFMTSSKVTEEKPFYIQYDWYIGIAAPSRTLPDVVAYTVTVPNAYVGPGEDGFAPSNWTVEYRDGNTGRWVAMEGAEVSAANFNDGDDVDVDGDEVTSGGVAKKLFFLLP